MPGYKAASEPVSRLENLQSGGGRGIINAKSALVNDIKIDGLTNCLLDRKTGEECTPAVARASLDDVAGLKKDGWKFDWTKCIKDGNEVYKVTLSGDNVIQGLTAIQNDSKNSAVHMVLLENNPKNIGESGTYQGVGAHLAAVACKKSADYGHGGFVYFDAKNALIKHYEDTLGAIKIGAQRMVIEEKPAKKLIDKYKLGG